VNPEFTGEPYDNVTDLESRRSTDLDATVPTRTALEFIVAHLRLHGGQNGWVAVSQIYTSGIAEGHTRDAIKAARIKSRDPHIESTNTGPNSMWRLSTTNEATA
jgi:hypothetical protein